MIAPDMATMLSFVVTDADIAPGSAAGAAVRGRRSDLQFDDRRQRHVDLRHADAVCHRCCRGRRPGACRAADDPRLASFRAALNDLLKDLALQVVRDGEGATKMLEITVTGAESDAAAKVIALSIANSPLVKTAAAGEDANWGRIVMAVGKAGEMADRDRLAIWFGDVRVAVNGERDAGYSEEAASNVMKKQDIPVKVEIGLGNGKARSGPAT
jgi:glutamate N-acetyltransferase/amino-acid N-acetyltransferase